VFALRDCVFLSPNSLNVAFANVAAVDVLGSTFVLRPRDLESWHQPHLFFFFFSSSSLSLL
jgi:hypothetical protein